MKNTLSNYIIDYKLASKLNIDFLKDQTSIPLKEENLFIILATSHDNLDEVYFSKNLNKPIKKQHFTKKEILLSLNHFNIKYSLYDIATNTIKQDSKIDTFLDTLIGLALDINTSDIHIESAVNSFIIRFRIDGVIKHIITLPKNFLNTLSSYIKLKANLDISLKRMPQNSSFTLIINDKKYDFRISTMPTIEGESIVIRILENNAENKKLETLGFSDGCYKSIKEIINYSNGLILVTGPTGSGKTTTLYSMVKEINFTGKKIITIEDPIEYKIENIQQISVNPQIGLTFEKILTNILRQDPDVILIGEIRDKESLKIAIQASLTGHLVLATLHTNDALNTINRVLNLEGEPFLLAATLKSIISQRLVRKLCDDCKTFDQKKDTFVAVGCENCNFEGYKDRVILYEFLDIDENISEMIAKKETNDKILKYLKNNNYIDIKEYSKTILKNGISSIEEIYKVVPL